MNTRMYSPERHLNPNDPPDASERDASYEKMLESFSPAELNVMLRVLEGGLVHEPNDKSLREVIKKLKFALNQE